MSDYAEMLMNVGKNSTPQKTHMGSNQNWMDAYGQQGQKSWRDYYDNYRKTFGGQQPEGYSGGGYGAALGTGGGSSRTPQYTFMQNMYQRHLDNSTQQYQDWMEKYNQQQKEWQDSIFKWLGQYYGTPEQPGQPEQPMSIYDMDRYQQIANRYAPLNAAWGNSGRDWDLNNLKSVVQQQMEWIQNAPRENLDKLVAGWGEGYNTNQWLNDMYWLAGQLGLSGDPQKPTQPTQPTQPVQDDTWKSAAPIDNGDQWSQALRGNIQYAPTDRYGSIDSGYNIGKVIHALSQPNVQNDPRLKQMYEGLANEWFNGLPAGVKRAMYDQANVANPSLITSNPALSAYSQKPWLMAYSALLNRASYGDMLR